MNKKPCILFLALFSTVIADDFYPNPLSHLALSIDYLYLKADVRLPWVTEFSKTNQGLSGRARFIPFNWDSGFRAALGTALPYIH